MTRTSNQNARPSRRRPRRSDVVTFRVRVELEGTSPPVWRRLELASDLYFDRVHDIMQAAFGWDDSHLHRFNLILVAAPAPGDLDAAVARFLADIGWATSDGTPMTALMASRAAWDTASMLRRLGAVTDDPSGRRTRRITAEGTAFARAALRTWPGSP